MNINNYDIWIIIITAFFSGPDGNEYFGFSNEMISDDDGNIPL